MNTKLIFGACALSVAIASLTSCSDEQNVLTGEGKVMLSTKVNSDVKVVSRAVTEEELNENLIVWISNSKGAVRKYNGLANIPEDGISLVSNHYIVEGWTGDSISASWDAKYYKGREEFDITNGNTTNVTLTCKIANTLVSVEYDDEVKTLLDNRKLTVGHSRGELAFSQADDNEGDKAYFMMPSTDTDLQWNLEGDLTTGTLFTKSGVIESVKPATEYVLHVKYTDKTPDEIGGGYFTIEIEEKTIDVEDEFVLTMAPKINGYDFDIDSPIYTEKGSVGRRSIYTTVSGTFSNFVVESSLLTDIIGGEDVDIMRMSDNVSDKLVAGGINFTQGYDAVNDNSWLKLNFEESILNNLENGEYAITFTVTDSLGKTSSKTLSIVISDAKIVADDVVEADVWSRHATVTATILKPEDVTTVGIQYRVSGGTWTDAVVTRSDDTLTAELTGLTPGTTYEVVAVADGVATTSFTKKFTTELADQMPNSSFELSYTGSDKALCFGSDASSMFWDSGNHGSITMNKNVTQLSTDKKHAGDYSLKLESQFVGVGTIGKFAAGNVFVGKYLKTDGTDGVLGFGRAWTSRPVKLKGYYHYTPGSVAYTSSDLSSVSKGDTDQGIIYIAILDDSYETYNSENWPVVIKTKSSERQLFSKSNSNVIAYGELVLTQATDGSDMVQFEIPLEYIRKDVKASNILLTCSASRYGDYFVGGSSVLYLDSFELVYE